MRNRSRCDRCAAELEAARQARQPYRAGYRTNDHRRFVAAVRSRAQGRCERCGITEADARARDDGRGLECHHILPLSRGGTNDPSNGVALCGVCHDAEGTQGGKRS